jgi:hypothetical protein
MSGLQIVLAVILVNGAVLAVALLAMYQLNNEVRRSGR